MNSYPPLASRTALRGPVRVSRLQQHQPVTTMDSPALEVMTDLTRIAAAVVSPGTTVDDANHFMMRRGVRMLLVLDGEEVLAGIVTATDIMGEAPITLARERGVRHSDITVGDVMTPAHRLDAFELDKVRSARVGNIVASLRQHRRHHALVTQPDGSGALEVRGIFSLSQIARQLGTALALPDAADSFAEIEAALAH